MREGKVKNAVEKIKGWITTYSRNLSKEEYKSLLDELADEVGSRSDCVKAELGLL